MHPVSVARLEEMGTGLKNSVGELLKRSDIVHDPETPPVCADHEIVKMLLDHHMVDRCMRQVVLQRKPVLAVIKGDIDGILCP